MTTTFLELIGAPATLLALGGAIYMIKRNRTDTNRLGKMLKDTIKSEEKRHNNVNLAILRACSGDEQKQKEIAALLREEV